MRNAYIRPLDFNYADGNEKKYRLDNVPSKFLEEPDDYEERANKPPKLNHSDSL